MARSIITYRGRVKVIRLRHSNFYFIQLYAVHVIEVSIFFLGDIIVFLQVAKVWFICVRRIVCTLKWLSSLIHVVSHWYGTAFEFENVRIVSGVNYPVRTVGYE